MQHMQHSKAAQRSTVDQRVRTSQHCGACCCRVCWQDGWCRCPSCREVDVEEWRCAAITVLKDIMVQTHRWMNVFRQVMSRDVNEAKPHVPFAWCTESAHNAFVGDLETVALKSPDFRVPHRLTPPVGLPKIQRRVLHGEMTLHCSHLSLSSFVQKILMAQTRPKLALLVYCFLLECYVQMQGRRNDSTWYKH